MMEYSQERRADSPAMASSVEDRIRRVLKEQAQLGVDAATLDAAGDLYEAGMTSRASVSVMLALESEFEIEFPDSMLRRDVFQSIEAIAAAVEQLVAGR